jgi:hypothetical protein
MITFIIGFSITTIWIGYEIWRAPMMRENEDGTWTTIKPTKRLSDLFKKKTFSSSNGTYKELEKLGRGRSKY